MKPIRFSKEETRAIVGKIQTYFQDELDAEIGDIPAEMLMRFFTEEIGGFIYNRGLYDAQAVLVKQVDEITDMIYALEQRETAVR